jgi:hypothetical protein
LRKLSLLAIPLLVLALTCVSQAQSIQQLTHSAPDGVVLSYQLTDGTVMAQGGNDSDWWKLTPDKTGSYVNGTWTQLASLPSGYSPDAEASAVLADGRLLIEGGEYNFGSFTLTNLPWFYPTARFSSETSWSRMSPHLIPKP